MKKMVDTLNGNDEWASVSSINNAQTSTVLGLKHVLTSVWPDKSIGIVLVKDV